MTPGLFWTLALAAAAVAALVLLVRGLLTPVPEEGTGSSRERLTSWRDHLLGSRPVNLGTWPEVLAGQALRAARPVPGGRVVPAAYQVRCGAGLYGTAAAHTSALEKAFVDVLRDCCEPDELPADVRIRFAFDGSLAGEAYRLDLDLPHGSPVEDPSGTVLHVPSPSPTSAGPGPDAEETIDEPALSWWSVVLADGSRHRLPEGATSTVGASADCDLCVCESHVSARHLRLIVDEDRLEVRDGAPYVDGSGHDRIRPSMNGTFLRGHPVSRATLTAGTAPVPVRLGPDVELSIEFGDPAETHPLLDDGYVPRHARDSR